MTWDKACNAYWPNLPEPAAAALIRMIDADVARSRLAEDAFLAVQKLATTVLPNCTKSHVMHGHYLWNLREYAAASRAWRHAWSLQPHMCNRFRTMADGADIRALTSERDEKWLEQDSYNAHGRTPWRPVQPINTSLHIEPYDSVAQLWRTIAPSIKDRLVRLWAAEAGVIEGIYELNEGVPTAIARFGFDILRDTDITNKTRLPKQMVFRVMQDHSKMLRNLTIHAKGERNISEQFVLDMHFTMTAHTPFMESQDPDSGLMTLALLPRGQWKRGANGVGRLQTMPAPECPAQMRRLVELFNEYMITQDPLLTAAWVQYEFVRAHCFADTNGRTSRALGSLPLLQANLPPFALDPSRRKLYYNALILANNGHMQQWLTFVHQEMHHLISRLDQAE
eukprot:TRINITY_DN8458_c0_g1_i2.p1 TRINITY_DN8458_c0_g1~~TRINITY_DN8458_c0_g1_i2.p1  ORF type:complete len:424 (+),score=40.37 TRINITY_DN8458_c0_g1_i2:90-1274(+)